MPRGGKRPGAGAPKGNLNGLKTGLHSQRLKALAAGIAADPALLRYLLEAVHRQKRDRKKAERAALRALQEMVLGLDSPDNPLRRYADQIFALQVEQREIQSVPKEGNQTHLSQDRDP